MADGLQHLNNNVWQLDASGMSCAWSDMRNAQLHLLEPSCTDYACLSRV